MDLKYGFEFESESIFLKKLESKKIRINILKKFEFESTLYIDQHNFRLRPKIKEPLRPIRHNSKALDSIFSILI